jgi:hypothetical protein
MHSVVESVISTDEQIKKDVVRQCSWDVRVDTTEITVEVSPIAAIFRYDMKGMDPNC